MLYNLLTPLADEFGFLNLFRYLTFRTGGAIMTSLVISIPRVASSEPQPRQDQIGTEPSETRLGLQRPRSRRGDAASDPAGQDGPGDRALTTAGESPFRSRVRRCRPSDAPA